MKASYTQGSAPSGSSTPSQRARFCRASSASSDSQVTFCSRATTSRAGRQTTSICVVAMYVGFKAVLPAISWRSRAAR